MVKICMTYVLHLFFILRLRLWQKLFRAEHSAKAKGENCAYGPTLNYRDSPLSTVSISTVPGLVRFSNSTKSADSPV